MANVQYDYWKHTHTHTMEKKKTLTSKVNNGAKGKT